MRDLSFVTTLGSAFSADTGYNDGYPILKVLNYDENPTASLTYIIAIDPALEAGATVTTSPANEAEKNETVTVYVTAPAGKELDKLTFTPNGGSAVDITAAKSFVMPNANVVISAVFKDKAGVTPPGDDTPEGNTPWTNPFADVQAKDWFAGAVEYVSKNGLMAGVSTTEFAPGAPMTRAMLATVLYRIAGQPRVSGASTFSDVAAEQWYTNAVIWANAEGIVAGYGDGIFGTNDNITREQIVAILYRYAKLKGYDVSATTDISRYTDAAAVSDYALAAVKWANAIGLLSGRTETTIVPEGNATRAEVATLLWRFTENVR
ncbi:MAG: S-layer homology domain-containing protein [Oscillospiraceae bacterium]|nr:S-layer homology domain-containing protein [Oscillospiraceae bacterium]